MGIRKMVYVAIGSLILFQTSLLQAQSDRKSSRSQVLKVHHVDNFEFTGDGTNPAWESASWISIPYREGAKQSFATDAKLLYSDSGIYCLFRCMDDKVTSTMSEDFADLWKEDVVEIFFWTDESVPLYFEYELSPLNHELPILVPNFDGTFLGWRPWHYDGYRKTRHATDVKSTYWMAEFFIPFALFKPLQNVPPKKGSTWRCNMYRIDHDAGSTEWSWLPVQTNFHDFKRFGSIQFD